MPTGKECVTIARYKGDGGIGINQVGEQNNLDYGSNVNRLQAFDGPGQAAARHPWPGSGSLPGQVLVVMPAYNEAKAIGPVIRRSRKYADYVVVIDDGSSDNTAEVARSSGAEIVAHEKNGGYGVALMTCFETGRRYDPEVMVIIDSDGQHDPDDIPLLIDCLSRSGADIVIGSRFVNGNGRNQRIPLYRKMGMKVLDAFTSLGSGVRVTDSQCGFRAYSRRAIRAIRPENVGMGAGSEILIRAAKLGLCIREVPVKVRYDTGASSARNPVLHGIDVLACILRLTIGRNLRYLFPRAPGGLKQERSAPAPEILMNGDYLK